MGDDSLQSYTLTITYSSLGIILRSCNQAGAVSQQTFTCDFATNPGTMLITGSFSGGATGLLDLANMVMELAPGFSTPTTIEGTVQLTTTSFNRPATTMVAGRGVIIPLFAPPPPTKVVTVQTAVTLSNLDIAQFEDNPTFEAAFRANYIAGVAIGAGVSNSQVSAPPPFSYLFLRLCGSRCNRSLPEVC
jgi:hypothetical protein